jgi:hypothetical protein
MTMLDDDRLASLLASAGDAFEVPPSGAATILARAARATAGEVDDGDVDDGDAVDGGHDDGLADGGGDESGVDEGSWMRRRGRPRRIVAAAGRHRALTVAACLVVVLAAAAAIGASVRGPAQPTLTAGLPPHAKPAPSNLAPTTTTVPHHPPGYYGSNATSGQGLAQAGGTQDLHASPFSAASGNAAPAQTTTPTASAPPLPDDAVGQSAKIEQTGTLGLSVGKGDLGRAMTTLTGLATANGGFVANSQTQSGPGTAGAPSGTVTLQVPVDTFASVLKQAQKVGRTTSLTTKATDVTGQYVDLQSRIDALQASRQQYLAIMAKATTVGDVLAVQAQLNTIESQIEQLQGQLQLLTSQTSYSTVTFDVSEGTPPAQAAPAPGSGVVRAWHDSVGGFVAGVEGIIRVAGPLLFALLCLAAVLIGGRALWRRAQRHRL